MFLQKPDEDMHAKSKLDIQIAIMCVRFEK